MLNTTASQVVNNSKFSRNFVKPCYDSYCFANIPGTIEFLLTGKGQSALPLDVLGNLPTKYDKVVLFFIDAFGWRFFEHYAERFSFLKTVLAQGVVSKMTSQFPSTTAAHVTCIHTGLPVGQSGIYEWSYYEPLLDEIISPLLFSYARDKVARDTIKASTSLPGGAFFPGHTFYQTLQAQGITSHILQYRAYTPATYSDAVFQGAHVHPYDTLQDAFVDLNKLLTTPGPAYYFLYFDRIDLACHRYGPYSRQFEEAVESCLTMIEQLFYNNVHGKVGNTLFMLTADHGQIEVDPKVTWYLNKQVPDFIRYLQTNKKGTPLVPAGSPRDMFLHVKEEYIDTAIGELQQHLAGKAEVYRTQELIEQHFFGLQKPSSVFLNRVGNVVILPYKNETVWWYEEGLFDMHFLGHHGGLLAEEMEIPLLVLPL